ncbi:hypothetical protein ETB97_004154 [Aspergillus alliaceus]|uniref:Uncharacterized protein n=1 Tax=Petromyces alliaceus TaxID=209559 RepID=A0A8H6ACT8_PETAA|nr:hypothetical protein ETB97_004154 [Aspergillus burnettii]
MTNSLSSYDAEASQPQVIDPWEEGSQYATTPGNFGRTPATLYSLSPTPDPITRQTQPDYLRFLPFAEWEEGEDYEREPPEFICYTIARKIIINHRIETRETEQDLVVAPKDTAIVVSVNHRNQNDLEKLYKSTNIDWRPVERQLRKWSNLLRMGKQPKIAISFKYIRDDDDLQHRTPRKGDKRGASATKRMLAERDAQILAEEEGSEQPSSWRYVYKLLRCSVTSCCHFGQWCWQDPQGRKHYKLRKPHLQELTNHVNNGGKLDSHDDVPENIRQALYLEAQQKLERGSNKVNNQLTVGAPCPINITVLQYPRRAHMSLSYLRHCPDLYPQMRDSKSLGPGI